MNENIGMLMQKEDDLAELYVLAMEDFNNIVNDVNTRIEFILIQNVLNNTSFDTE